MQENASLGITRQLARSAAPFMSTGSEEAKGMADNEFGKMLLAEIRRHHEKVERLRAAYLQDLDETPPATTQCRFRVINGGKADHVAS
jgi:hypothetical protein